MNILLPVDVRGTNIQGFIVLNTAMGETTGFETIELLK